MNRLLQLLDKCSKKGKSFCVKAITALVILVMAGSIELQAQTIADGVYYISHTNRGWYLWPSVIQNTGTTNEYLTTFNATDAPAVQNKYDIHDNTYCHWVVKNVEGVTGAFQLINPKLNKYVVKRDKNTGDRDVWLMDNPTGSDLTRSYFYIYKDDATSPYRITFDNTKNYSFNSAAGDKTGFGIWW